MKPIPGLALLKRELLTALRSGRVYLLVVLTLCITSAILLFVITAMALSGAPPGGEISAILLLLLTFSLYGAALLFLPPVAAVSICLEKQRDTWPLLQTALVAPWQIVLAKILNVLVIYLFIVIATLPLVGVLFFFVGIDFDQYFHAMAVVVMTGIATAAWSVFCSAWFYRTLAAIAVAYIGVILLVTGLGWVLLGALMGLSSYLLLGVDFEAGLSSIGIDLDDFAVFLLRLFCPSFDLVQGIPYIGPSSGASTPWAGCVYLALLSLFAFLGALGRVRRAPRPLRVDQRKIIDDAQVLEERRKKFPYYLIDPQRRRRPIPDGRNPMFAKEVLASVIGRGTNLVRIAYVFAIPCFFYALFLSFDHDYRGIDEGLLLFQFIQGIVLLLIAPALVANSVVKEYELGNMDMLRMTLLHPHQIVLGKLFGGASGLIPPLIGMAIGSLPAVVAVLRRGDDATLNWLATNIMFAVTLVLVLTLTLRISIGCRSLPTALLLSYLAMLFLLLIAPWVFLMVLDEMHLRLTPLVLFVSYIPSPPSCLIAAFAFVDPRRVTVLPAIPLLRNWCITLIFSALLFGTAVIQFRRRHMREK